MKKIRGIPRTKSSRDFLEESYVSILSDFLPQTDFLQSKTKLYFSNFENHSDQLIPQLAEKFFQEKHTSQTTAEMVNILKDYQKKTDFMDFIVNAFNSFYFTTQFKQKMLNNVNSILPKFDLQSQNLDNDWYNPKFFYALLSIISDDISNTIPSDIQFSTIISLCQKHDIPCFLNLNMNRSIQCNLVILYQIESLLKIIKDNQSSVVNDDSMTDVKNENQYDSDEIINEVNSYSDDETTNEVNSNDIQYNSDDRTDASTDESTEDFTVNHNSYVKIINRTLSNNYDECDVTDPFYVEHKHFRISYLSEFNNGIVFPLFITALTGKEISNLIPNPEGFDKDRNNQKVFDHLRTSLSWKDISPNEFNFDDENDLINFIRIFLKKMLYIQAVRNSLLNSVNEILEHEQVKQEDFVSNFHKDWNDGQKFLILLRYYCSDTLSLEPYRDLDFPTLSSLFAQYGVEVIIDENSLFGNPDEMAIMIQVDALIEKISEKFSDIPPSRRRKLDQPTIIKPPTCKMLYVYIAKSDPLLRTFNALGSSIHLTFNKIEDVIHPLNLPNLVRFVLSVASIPGVSLTNTADNISNTIKFLKEQNPEFKHFTISLKPMNKKKAETFCYHFLKCFFLKRKNMIEDLNILISDSITVRNYSDFRFGNPFYPLLYLITQRRIKIGMKPLTYYDGIELINQFYKAEIPYVLDEESLIIINKDAINYQLQFIFNKLDESNTPITIVQSFMKAIAILRKMKLPDFKKLAAGVKERQREMREKALQKQEDESQKQEKPHARKDVIFSPQIRAIFAKSGRYQQEEEGNNNVNASLTTTFRSQPDLFRQEEIEHDEVEDKIQQSISSITVSKDMFIYRPPVTASSQPKIISDFNNKLNFLYSQLNPVFTDKMPSLEYLTPRIFTIFKWTNGSWNFLKSNWDQFRTENGLNDEDQLFSVFFMSSQPKYSSSIASTIMQFGYNSDDFDTTSDPIVQIVLMGSTEELCANFNLNINVSSKQFVIFINIKYPNDFPAMNDIVKMETFLTIQSHIIIMPTMLSYLTEMFSHFESVKQLLNQSSYKPGKGKIKLEIPFAFLINDTSQNINTEEVEKLVANMNDERCSELNRVKNYFNYESFFPLYQWINVKQLTTYKYLFSQIIQTFEDQNVYTYFSSMEEMFQFAPQMNVAKNKESMKVFLNDLYNKHLQILSKQQEIETERDNYLLNTTRLKDEADKLKKLTPKASGIINEIQHQNGKVIVVKKSESELSNPKNLESQFQVNFNYVIEDALKTKDTPVSERFDTVIDMSASASITVFEYADHSIDFKSNNWDRWCNNNKIKPTDHILTVLVSNSVDYLISPILTKLSKSAIRYPENPSKFFVSVHFCGFVADIQKLYGIPSSDVPTTKTGICFLVPHKPQGLSNYDILNMESSLVAQCDCILTLTNSSQLYDQFRIVQSIRNLTVPFHRKTPNIIYLLDEMRPELDKLKNINEFAAFCERLNRVLIPKSKLSTIVLKPYLAGNDMFQWIDSSNWGSYYSLYRTILIASKQSIDSSSNTVKNTKDYYLSLNNRGYSELFFALYQNQYINSTQFNNATMNAVYEKNMEMYSREKYFTLGAFNEIIYELFKVLPEEEMENLKTFKNSFLDMQSQEILISILFDYDDDNNFKLKGILNYINNSVTYIDEKMKNILIDYYVSFIKSSTFSKIMVQLKAMNYGTDFGQFVYRKQMKIIEGKMDHYLAPINDAYERYKQRYTKKDDEIMDIDKTISNSMNYVMTETQVVREINVEVTTDADIDEIIRTDF